eukprot:1834370-Prorocentrum_lima.AAC.1
MTSSLVGSEMCIRDRVGMPCRPTPLEHEQLPWAKRKEPFHYVVSSSAVSYTHLTLPTICSV